MNIINNLIKAENEAKAAAAKLAAAKLAATKFMQESDIDKVESLGYTVSLKQYSRQKVKTTNEIDALEQQLEIVMSSLAENHLEEIYETQQAIHHLEYKLHNLVNNEETTTLTRLINSLKDELAQQSNAKYDVKLKFDVKSSAMSQYVTDREFKNLVVEGKKLASICGKSISQTEVAKCIIAWAHSGTSQTLNEFWEDRVGVHIADNKVSQ